MTHQDRPRDDTSSDEWDARARFLAGEGTPDERREMQRALDVSPAHASLLHALDDALQAPDVAPPATSDVEAALASVRARASETRSGVGSRRAEVVSLDTYRSRWRNARFAAAAAVLVVAGASLVWRAAISPRCAVRA